MTKVKALRLFVLSALIIYGGGVVYSHIVYSADDRAACSSAGGFVGRIWCPDAVDTEGFQAHFVRALIWPIDVIPTPAKTAKAAKELELAALAQKREEDAKTLRKLQPLAQKGDARAQFKLGVMYQEGLYGTPNHVAAAKWFQQAADRGETEAQNRLSFAYEKGLGVGQNYVEAYKWASLATIQGAEKTLVARDTLIAKMTPDQIEEAERRTRAWQPKDGEAEFRRWQEASKRALVKEAQTLLNTLGYKVGVPDGEEGPRTQGAISEFQLSDGMQESGLVSDELVARLKNRVQAKQANTATNR